MLEKVLEDDLAFVPIIGLETIFVMDKVSSPIYEVLSVKTEAHRLVVDGELLGTG